jgi:hypothetical protein
MSDSDDNAGTFPMEECPTPHRSQHNRCYNIKQTSMQSELMQSERSSGDDAPLTSLANEDDDDDDDEDDDEVPSSIPIVHPRNELVFEDNDEGDESYDNGQAAESTSDDEQPTNQKHAKASSKKKKATVTKVVNMHYC